MRRALLLIDNSAWRTILIKHKWQGHNRHLFIIRKSTLNLLVSAFQDDNDVFSRIIY